MNNRLVRLILIITAAFAFIVAVAGTGASAAPGDFDLTFNASGYATTGSSGNDWAKAMAIQADGKIIVAGSFAGTDHDFGLARFNSTGTLDTSFGVGCCVSTDFGYGDDEIQAIALQSDGSIVVAGTVSGVNDLDIAVSRYSSAGNIDLAFGTNGYFIYDSGGGDDEARGVAVQSDGSIIIVGTVYSGVNYDFGVFRLSPNGAVDSSFGTNGKLLHDFGTGDDVANAVAIQSNGKIIVVGRAETSGASGIADAAFIRLNTNGSLDTSFMTGGFGTLVYPGNGQARAVALQSDGKIVITGQHYSSSRDQTIVVRFDTDGLFDSSFNAGIVQANEVNSNYANAVAIQSDGKIVVAGNIRINSFSRIRISRFNSDGTADSSWGSTGIVESPIGTRSDAAAVAIQSDGKIVIAGETNSTNDNFVVARYEISGSAQTTTTSTTSTTPTSTTTTPTSTSSVTPSTSTTTSIVSDAQSGPQGSSVSSDGSATTTTSPTANQMPSLPETGHDSTFATFLAIVLLTFGALSILLTRASRD